MLPRHLEAGGTKVGGDRSTWEGFIDGELAVMMPMLLLRQAAANRSGTRQ